MKTNYERKAEEDMKHISSLLTEKDVRITVYRDALEIAKKELSRYSQAKLSMQPSQECLDNIEQALSQPPSELLERVKKLEELKTIVLATHGKEGKCAICEFLRKLEKS